MPAPGGKWDADQARRFFQAFQQHGTVFDKVRCAAGCSHGSAVNRVSGKAEALPARVERWQRGLTTDSWCTMAPSQVSEALDGTATPEACEGLYGQHRAYLSLDPKFQSEVRLGGWRDSRVPNVS